MARTMKKFSAGGSERYKARMDRKTADIEKDYKIALAKGKNADVAKAKYEQRKADAADDFAKWTKADRTKTKAGEKAAEATLTEARRTKGESIKKRDMATDISKFFAGKDMTPKAAEPAKAATPAASKPKTRGEAFKAARKELGAGKTFTYEGKSYSTNIAGEGRKASTSGGTGTGTTAATASAAAAAAAAKVKQDAAAAKVKQDAAAAKAKQNRSPINAGRSPGVLANLFSGSASKLSAGERAKRAGLPAHERMAKGGSVKKEKTMKYAKGGSTPPQPTAADRARSKKQLAELKKLKPTAEQAKVIASANRSEGPGYKKGGSMASCGMKKGGKAKAKPFAATKFGAAMKKKSADTKGRAMMKFAKGGSIDGCATKGKTKGKMV